MEQCTDKINFDIEEINTGISQSKRSFLEIYMTTQVKKYDRRLIHEIENLPEQSRIVICFPKKMTPEIKALSDSFDPEYFEYNIVLVYIQALNYSVPVYIAYDCDNPEIKAVYLRWLDSQKQSV